MDPFFLVFLAPRVQGVREEVDLRFPHAQTLINQARVACALERYRLVHGQFPESLDTLVPQFLAELPRDAAAGEPFRYRRTDDGRFLLYARGADGVDDGGRPVKVEFDWSGSPVSEPGPGDWVWGYPGAAHAAPEVPAP
jgi:hypothetical protein